MAAASRTEKPWERRGNVGVSDGARTRDVLDHNQVLYQLSYTHHAPTNGQPATSETAAQTATGPV